MSLHVCHSNVWMHRLKALGNRMYMYLVLALNWKRVMSSHFPNFFFLNFLKKKFLQDQDLHLSLDGFLWLTFESWFGY